MSMNNKDSIQGLLKWGEITLKENNISNYSMEARWLFSFVSKIDYEYIITHNNELLSEEIIKKYTSVIFDRALNKKPFQLITGTATFYGREFNIFNNVFIPRQDSEVIIDILKKKVSNHFLIFAPVRDVLLYLPI